MTTQRQTVLTAFMGTGALLAALLIYQIAAPLPAPDVPVVQLKPMATPVSSVAPVITPPPEAFAEIGARPMFSPARKSAASSADAAQALPPPDVSLVGIIVDNQTRLALLKSQTVPFATAYGVGQSISGWQVAEIAPDRVVLNAGPARLELKLAANRAPPRPAAPPNMSNSQ